MENTTNALRFINKRNGVVRVDLARTPARNAIAQASNDKAKQFS